MLTPRFSIAQEPDWLTVTIHAPFTSIAETEVFAEGPDFRFFSPPYFLRLHLPGDITEERIPSDGIGPVQKSEATYVADDASFVIRVPKAVPGQYFKGLDMLTDLLTPKGSSISEANKIEEVGVGLKESEQDWYCEQRLPPDDSREDEVSSMSIGQSSRGYGFAFQRTNVFAKLPRESQEVLDVKDPDELMWCQRREKRLEMEQKDFSGDHYLCDLFEPAEPALKSLNDTCVKSESPQPLELSDEDRERMVMLPRKQYLVEESLLSSVGYGLVDLLFAYCYDLRVGEGDHTAEASWNMVKLSATLSCSEKFDSIHDCVVSCLRRSLCYPLVRNYAFSWQVLADVRDLLCESPEPNVAVLKALLAMIPIMISGDGTYIFNQLYIEPYAVWVQSMPFSCLESVGKALQKVMSLVTKDDVGLELVELEQAALLVKEEAESETVGPSDLAIGVSSVCLGKQNHDLDSDDDSETSSSSSSSEDSDDTSSESDDHAATNENVGEKVIS